MDDLVLNSRSTAARSRERPMKDVVVQDGHAIAKGAEALLREHPGAQVCALAVERADRARTPDRRPVGSGPDRGPRADRQRRRRRPHGGREAVARRPEGRRGADEGAHARDPHEVVDAPLHRPARSARRLPRRDPAQRRGRRRRAERAGERARRPSLLHPHRGRGRARARRRRRLHADVRLHRGGAARQVGARPDPPRRPGTRRRGLARSDLQQPRAADAPAPPAQGRQLHVGRHHAAQLPQPPRTQLRGRRDHRHLRRDGRPGGAARTRGAAAAPHRRRCPSDCCRSTPSATSSTTTPACSTSSTARSRSTARRRASRRRSCRASRRPRRAPGAAGADRQDAAPDPHRGEHRRSSTRCSTRSSRRASTATSRSTSCGRPAPGAAR